MSKQNPPQPTSTHFYQFQSKFHPFTNETNISTVLILTCEAPNPNPCLKVFHLNCREVVWDELKIKKQIECLVFHGKRSTGVYCLVRNFALEHL